MVRAFALQSVDLGLILSLSRTKRFLKRYSTASLPDVQHQRDSMEKNLAILLVSFCKTLNVMSPLFLGGQVAGLIKTDLKCAAFFKALA